MRAVMTQQGLKSNLNNNIMAKKIVCNILMI